MNLNKFIIIKNKLMILKKIIFKKCGNSFLLKQKSLNIKQVFLFNENIKNLVKTKNNEKIYDNQNLLTLLDKFIIKDLNLDSNDKFHNLAQEFEKLKESLINVNYLDEINFYKMIDFLYEFPYVLRNNIKIYNSIDTKLLTMLEKEDKIKNDEFILCILKFMVISLNLMRGSSRLYNRIQEYFLKNKNIINDHLIYVNEIINWSSRVQGKLTKEFSKYLITIINNKEYLNKKKPSEILNLLYNIAILNLITKEFYENFILLIDNFIFDRIEDCIKLLWSFCIYNVHFNDFESQNSMINIINNINLNKISINKSNKMVIYKLFEINLFMKLNFPIIYEKLNEIKILKIEENQIRLNRDPELSSLQNDIKIILNISKINYEIEKIIENIYMIDFFIKPNIIIEVNGPVHYSFLNDDSHFNGKNVIKHSILTKSGYKLVNISYIEWYMNKGVRSKIDFILNKLYS